MALSIGIFEIIRGSSKPDLQVTLQNSDGTAFDLTGNTGVKLVVAPSFETATGSLLLDATMTVVGAATGGIVKKTWTITETNIAAGTYRSMVEVTFSGTSVAKFGPFTFKVTESLRA